MKTGRSILAGLAGAVAMMILMLLDEPFAGLDPSLRADVRDAVIAAQAVHGSAIVIVTHDLDDAAWLGDHIAFILDRRRIIGHPGSAMTYVWAYADIVLVDRLVKPVMSLVQVCAAARRAGPGGNTRRRQAARHPPVRASPPCDIGGPRRR